MVLFAMTSDDPLGDDLAGGAARLSRFTAAIQRGKRDLGILIFQPTASEFLYDSRT